METTFICPKEFDIKTATIIQIGSDFKKEYHKALMDEVEVISVKDEAERLKANGKTWKKITFPFEIIFENVIHEEAITRYNYRHCHTEFILFEKKIHIDCVDVWHGGPGTHQESTRIFVDDMLYSCAIKGGNSFGWNWGKGNPSTVVLENFILRYHGDFRTETKKYVFQPDETDFPVSLWVEGQ